MIVGTRSFLSCDMTCWSNSLLAHDLICCLKVWLDTNLHTLLKYSQVFYTHTHTEKTVSADNLEIFLLGYNCCLHPMAQDTKLSNVLLKVFRAKFLPSFITSPHPRGKPCHLLQQSTLTLSEVLAKTQLCPSTPFSFPSLKLLYSPQSVCTVFTVRQ